MKFEFVKNIMMVIVIGCAVGCTSAGTVLEGNELQIGQSKVDAKSPFLMTTLDEDPFLCDCSEYFETVGLEIISNRNNTLFLVFEEVTSPQRAYDDDKLGDGRLLGFYAQRSDAFDLIEERQEEQRRIVAEREQRERETALAIQRKKAEEEKRKQGAQKRAAERYAASLRLTEQEAAQLEARCTAYATIKGVCWALNFGEMRSVLNSRGYVSNATNQNRFVFNSGAVVLIRNTEVTFTCGVFNACDLSMRELALRLQRSGLVTGSMEFDSEYSAGYFENSSSSTSSLCGRGKQGEKICVSQTTSSLGQFVGTGDVSVSLGKGLVGREVSFD